jgi:hypothetical protein
LTLFGENAVVGLLDMDLLLTVDYVLLAIVFLALAVVLVRHRPSLVLVGMVLSIASLAPTATWLWLVARGLMKFGRV